MEDNSIVSITLSSCGWFFIGKKKTQIPQNPHRNISFVNSKCFSGVLDYTFLLIVCLYVFVTKILLFEVNM